MNIAETGCDREVWGNLLESLVDAVDIFWLGVQRVVVYILVVDTIFLTTSDTDFLRGISAELRLKDILDLPFPTIASLEQPASGTWRLSRCSSQPPLLTDRSCVRRTVAHRAP